IQRALCADKRELHYIHGVREAREELRLLVAHFVRKCSPELVPVDRQIHIYVDRVLDRVAGHAPASCRIFSARAARYPTESTTPFTNGSITLQPWVFPGQFGSDWHALSNSSANFSIS